MRFFSPSLGPFVYSAKRPDDGGFGKIIARGGGVRVQPAHVAPAIGVITDARPGRNCEINNADTDDITPPVYRVATVAAEIIDINVFPTTGLIPYFQITQRKSRHALAAVST